MDPERFLAGLAARLGRSAGAPPAPRDGCGVPERHRTHPLRAAGPGARRACFGAALRRAGGNLQECADAAALEQALREHLAAGGGPAVCDATAALAGLRLEWLVGEGLATPPSPGDAATWRARCAAAALGITLPALGVAETGTLVHALGPDRARLTSLLPRHHVAVLRESCLVPQLGDAFAALHGAPEALPSATVLVTGPSRTSDIENDATIGVHGPAAVTVLLLLDAP
ncbi:MAG: LUD domain-containing protein [Planctomycetes bacterium]|nr:LUD domain-containing protein [Planctomycetota bacterium]